MGIHLEKICQTAEKEVYLLRVFPFSVAPLCSDDVIKSAAEENQAIYIGSGVIVIEGKEAQVKGYSGSIDTKDFSRLKYTLREEFEIETIWWEKSDGRVFRKTMGNRYGK